MASSSFCCYRTFNYGQNQNNNFKKSHFPSIKPNGFSGFVLKPKIRGIRGISVVRAMNSDTKDSRKQIEIVYNPDEKLNKLAEDVDKQAGLSRLTLFSPCKVISLGDTIKFSLAPSKVKDRLSTNVPGVPLDDKNFSFAYGQIHLDKKVPTGAGLGGGSGNAATALWAANQFSGCLASEKELQEWSSEIGSDVPFFFSQGAAYCTGTGEVLQDIPQPIPLDLPMVLIKPQEACATAAVYKRLRLDQSSKVDPLSLLERISNDGISQDVCINDLEPPAFEVLPSLKRLKQRVLAAGRGQYDAVLMSGSGSTIVGIGSPDPPQFVYDDEDYQDAFVSEASFIARRENQRVLRIIIILVRKCQQLNNLKSFRIVSVIV